MTSQERQSLTLTPKRAPKMASGQSLNHLLNFSLPPRQSRFPLSLPRRSRRNGTHQDVWNKERFVNAQYRFVMTPTGDYTVHFADPDMYVLASDLLKKMLIIRTTNLVSSNGRISSRLSSHAPLLLPLLRQAEKGSVKRRDIWHVQSVFHHLQLPAWPNVDTLVSSPVNSTSFLPWHIPCLSGLLLPLHTALLVDIREPEMGSMPNLLWLCKWKTTQMCQMAWWALSGRRRQRRNPTWNIVLCNRPGSHIRVFPMHRVYHAHAPHAKTTNNHLSTSSLTYLAFGYSPTASGPFPLPAWCLQLRQIHARNPFISDHGSY